MIEVSSLRDKMKCLGHTRKRNFTLSKSCPSCGHQLEHHDHEFQEEQKDWPGLPSGVKFDPTDQELIEHLEAKVGFHNLKSHPLIDEFIPTLEGEDGICYTHPEKLPGISQDGLIRHFFHRPSKAYTTGTRKRRKIHTSDNQESNTGETRWHKTGKTRPVMVSGKQRGCKKILVLYTNFGKHRKPQKTNWVMHQYHLGSQEEEKEGELVVSKVFYQTQPRHCNNNTLDVGNLNQETLGNHEQKPCLVACDETSACTQENQTFQQDERVMSSYSPYHSSNSMTALGLLQIQNIMEILHGVNPSYYQFNPDLEKLNPISNLTETMNPTCNLAQAMHYSDHGITQKEVLAPPYHVIDKKELPFIEEVDEKPTLSRLPYHENLTEDFTCMQTQHGYNQNFKTTNSSHMGFDTGFVNCNFAEEPFPVTEDAEWIRHSIWQDTCYSGGGCMG